MITASHLLSPSVESKITIPSAESQHVVALAQAPVSVAKSENRLFIPTERVPLFARTGGRGAMM
jgi:hypothetical protein